MISQLLLNYSSRMDKPVSSRVLKFNGIEPESFETTLPYKVTEPTLARLTIRQDNPLIECFRP